jgi:hypothetical protein
MSYIVILMSFQTIYSINYGGTKQTWDLSIKNIASYANFRKVIHSSFQEQYCSNEHFCMEKTY